jgi:uncharacterized lipoprotein YajG
MKKSIVAMLTIASLFALFLIAGCGQPAAQPAAINGTYPSPQESLNRVVVVGTTEVERLEEMQRSIQLLIWQSLENGVVVSDALHDQTQSIEKARQEMIALDGQRSATHMLIAQYIMSGQDAPDCEYQLAQSIEQSRQEILKRVGLAD